jgi:hypothetical protein
MLLCITPRKQAHVVMYYTKKQADVASILNFVGSYWKPCKKAILCCNDFSHRQGTFTDLSAGGSVIRLGINRRTLYTSVYKYVQLAWDYDNSIIWEFDMAEGHQLIGEIEYTVRPDPCPVGLFHVVLAEYIMEVPPRVRTIFCFHQRCAQHAELTCSSPAKRRHAIGNALMHYTSRAPQAAQTPVSSSPAACMVSIAICVCVFSSPHRSYIETYRP